jgi:hypothetical protein
MALNKNSLILCILFALISAVGCSQVNFSQKKNNDLSSYSPPPEATNTPLPTAAPAAVSVKYPSYAKIANVPALFEQSEILINTQADNNSCVLSAFVSPIESNLCFDVPDLCWTTQINTVTKSTDYTCAQAFRAQVILAARGGNACVAATQNLTSLQISQINDPTIYKVDNDAVDTSGAVPDPTTVLPALNSISLDSACRCHYSSNDTPTFIYKYPALEEHCRYHFGDVYHL